MDDFLCGTHAMEGMLLDEFEQDQIGDDAHIAETFKSLKYASTPLYLNMDQGLPN